MKVKVINEELSLYNNEFKVINLNYDMVEIQGEEQKLYLLKDDVEIIPENKYEDAILRCRDIIKIKLNKGISLLFYTALIDCIELTIKKDIETIDLLQDDFDIIKKGIWEKRIVIVVNEKTALTISVIGRNYGNKFDITIKDNVLLDFIKDCCFQIEGLNKEVNAKMNLIDRYNKAIKDVIGNYISGSTEHMITDGNYEGICQKSL